MLSFRTGTMGPSREIVCLKLFCGNFQSILEMQDIFTVAIAISLSITSTWHNASWWKQMIICFWLFVVGSFKYQSLHGLVSKSFLNTYFVFKLFRSEGEGKRKSFGSLNLLLKKHLLRTYVTGGMLVCILFWECLLEEGP